MLIELLNGDVLLNERSYFEQAEGICFFFVKCTHDFGNDFGDAKGRAVIFTVFEHHLCCNLLIGCLYGPHRAVHLSCFEMHFCGIFLNSMDNNK